MKTGFLTLLSLVLALSGHVAGRIVVPFPENGLAKRDGRLYPNADLFVRHAGQGSQGGRGGQGGGGTTGGFGGAGGTPASQANGHKGGNGNGNDTGNSAGAGAASSTTAAGSGAAAAGSGAAATAAGSGKTNGATTTAAAAAAAESSPAAVNENGAPGPAVPQLNVDGSLTLDKSLLLTTQANANASAGQAASAVSNNNFISFCEGKTLTNGQQVTGGSCAVTPLGDIPASTNMVSATFTNPPNMGTVPAGKTFTISLATQNIVLGSFTDAQKDYYAAPQQLDAKTGNIVGHAHVCIQKMSSISSAQVLDPQTFDFFKGMDNADVNGISSVDVEGGLAAGAYRMCTIMSSSNHASVVLPVAQRGPENTCSYFTAQ